jgi:TonB-linked outer membrane protein, SusC/RagA family
MKKRIIILLSLLSVVTFVFAQNRIVTGTVTDDTGETVIGASVKIKGTSTGTITDLDGNFSIQAPNNNAVLQISYIGFQPREIRIGEQTHIRITLASDTEILDEVVIVGFGTQRKINATGAVKTIDNKILESRPIANAVQGLQGAVAGLNIVNDNGGGLGQAMEINIRGIGSIGEGSNSSPLILIDGIEGDLSSVNPNDIENISVLKDAAAASIYGSRAPFGVILVTTKSGSTEGKTSATYTGNVRISNPVSVPKPVDSYTYALMVNDAFMNAGGNPQFGAAQLNKILQYQRGELPYGIEPAEGQNDWAWGQRSFGNTDWYDEHLKDLTYSQEHNLSLRGGTKDVNYFLSANYFGQNGLFRYADEKYKRLSINGKLNIKIIDKLHLNWSTRLIDTENDKPSALNALFYHNLGRRSPLMPVYMPNGEYNKESMIPSLKEGGRSVNMNQLFYNQAQLTFEPLKNWRIYADLGSRIEKPRDTRQFKKVTISLPDGTPQYIPVLEGVADKNIVNENGTITRQPAAGISYYEKAYGHVNYFNTNFRSDYEMKFNNHYFKVLAGVQTEYFYTEKTRTASDDVLLDEKPFLPSGSGTNPRMSERKGEWSNIGIFGRINYNYADRYMAEVNLRGDGASRFPEDQRWGVFPSFSAGWNLGQEKFWESLYEKGFEMVKLRASYGILGNQNTQGFYDYYQKMEAVNGGFVLGGQEAVILPGPKPFSTSLTWEKIENTGVGLDLGFLSNRLSSSFDWFQRVTKDMVGPAKPLPGIFGANPPKTNNAELRTRGWELEIAWRDRIGKDLSYHITASLSDYESVVTKYDSPDGALSGYFKDKKLGDIWGYRVKGIAKSDREMNDWLSRNDQSALGQNWGGGDFMYKDLNEDGSVNAGGSSIFNPGDREVIGNGTPRYAFGLNLGVNWKFIDVSLFFQGIGKRDVFFDGSATFFGFAGEWQRSLYVDHLDYFRYAGESLGANYEDPYYARLRTDGNNRHVSDYYLQNAAYVRLKNAQIGFSLPSNNKISKYIRKGRIYLSGENLLTFTKLKIYDPEAIGSAISEYGPGKTYPMYRVFSVGLEVTF